MNILYFARLRETLDLVQEEVSLPPDVVTVGDLRLWLAARGGVWRREFAPYRLVRVAVNQTLVSPDTKLHPQDEVAFFPPMTGG